jgi:diguanylate cyclase (GGDEF)-like protein
MVKGRSVSIKFVAAIVFLLAMLFSTATAVEAEDYLTAEELDYIESRSTLRAASSDGAAPLTFTDSKGEIRGIFKRVMDRIAEMTGLVFEYELYDSVEKVFGSGGDIVYGVSPNYAPEGMVLSQPFLITETILYTNISLRTDQLDDKIYAAVRDSALPEGIKEEQSIYFNTREESLNAVDSGKADYGYGNAYSVAYYTLLNGYRNIVTIPRGKESREYCIGLANDDPILLSIINKTINEIDPTEMQHIILEVASQVERRITPAMVISAYGVWIFTISSLISAVLLFSVVSNVHANRRLRMQNIIHKVLSRISNEYLFEYSPKTDRFHLSDKFDEQFVEVLDKVTGILKNLLLKQDIDLSNELIEFPLANGKMSYFKVINTTLNDKRGRTNCIAGKLIDISEEVSEREMLIAKSQIDGLTGLYNPTTTRELIIKKMENRANNNRLDALIILDCDNFKEINDTLGHLVGDEMLRKISASLRKAFRSTDILGRIGGDEFCVYLEDVPSAEFVEKKFQQLLSLVQESTEEIEASLSVGIAFVNEKEPYETIFNKADTALFKAKGMGKARIVVYGE